MYKDQVTLHLRPELIAIITEVDTANRKNNIIMKKTKSKLIKIKLVDKRTSRLIKVEIVNGGGYKLPKTRNGEIPSVLQGGGYTLPRAAQGGGYCKPVAGGGYKNAKPVNVKKYYYYKN